MLRLHTNLRGTNFVTLAPWAEKCGYGQGQRVGSESTRCLHAIVEGLSHMSFVAVDRLSPPNIQSCTALEKSVAE